MNSKSVYLLIYIDKINNKENKYRSFIYLLIKKKSVVSKLFNYIFREL